MSELFDAFPGWHLAEINIARMRWPLDDERMAGFVAQLDEINRAAEQAEGFIWRLKAEGGAAGSYIEFSDDPSLIVNFSVWESIGALHRYAYRSAHAAPYRARRDWFEPLASPALALWWTPAGTIPPLAEARRRLARLEAAGPSAEAFTFKQPFAPVAVGFTGS